MTCPEGISESAWQKSRELGLIGYLDDDYCLAIAKAIQASMDAAVEAERERVGLICTSVIERLSGKDFADDFPGEVRATMTKCVMDTLNVLLKHIRKGA